MPTVTVKIQQSFDGAEIRTVELARLLQNAMDGSDYDTGQLEALERSVTKTQEMLCNIVDLLLQKGTLSQKEIEPLLCDEDQNNIRRAAGRKQTWEEE